MEDVKLVLVGNKVDLEDQRQVTVKRGEKVVLVELPGELTQTVTCSLLANTELNFLKPVLGKTFQLWNHSLP